MLSKVFDDFIFYPRECIRNILFETKLSVKGSSPKQNTQSHIMQSVDLPHSVVLLGNFQFN